MSNRVAIATKTVPREELVTANSGRGDWPGKEDRDKEGGGIMEEREARTKQI